MSRLFASLLEEKAAEKVATFSASTQKRLEQAGPFVTQFAVSFPDKVLEANEKKSGGEASELCLEIFNQGWLKSHLIHPGWEGWAKQPLFDRLASSTISVGKDFKTQIQSVDDRFGKMELSKLLMYKFLRNPNAFPIEDSIHFLDSDAQGTELLTELKLAPGQAMESSYHPFVKELASDVAMTYIFFYGIGAPLMQVVEDDSDGLGPFLVDVDLSQFEVREGFRRYGASARFDANQNITSIYDYAKDRLVKPGGGDDWEHAKNLLKQTAFLVITAREHLLWTHILCSNEITRASEDLLPPCHPVRRVLNVFTFRTNYINSAATETLLPYGSILFRGTALTFDSFQALLDASVNVSNILEPFADRKVPEKLQELSDNNQFPYVSDGKGYFEIVRTFVRQWLSQEDESKILDDHGLAFYDQLHTSSERQAYVLPKECTMESMINLVAQHIFNATAFHECVGVVTTYTQFAAGLGFRIVDGAHSTDLQSFIIVAIITALTGVRTPKLMNSFDKLFGCDGAPEYEVHVWKGFLSELEDFSAKVQKANETRKFPCLTFDPKVLECAVSV